MMNELIKATQENNERIREDLLELIKRLDALTEGVGANG